MRVAIVLPHGEEDEYTSRALDHVAPFINEPAQIDSDYWFGERSVQATRG